VGNVTELLKNLSAGDRSASSQLVQLVYDELRRLAQHYMGMERPNHTLQATALVHEAFLRLVKQERVSWQNRAHFIGVAAQIMRRILVDHARIHHADKRGGDQPAINLDEDGCLFSPEQSEQVVELEEALLRLAKLSPRQSRVVELRFFGGLSEEEIAEVLEVSTKTVKRDWVVAKAWLYREVQKQSTSDQGGQ